MIQIKTKVPIDTETVIEETKPDNFNLYFNKYRDWKITSEKEEVEPIRKLPKLSVDKNIIDKQMEVLSSYQNLGYNTILLYGDVDWRMVVGLGHPHVAETSMTLHHIYGIPYIPGSAIKGIVRNFYINNLYEKANIDNREQILIIEKICDTYNNKDKDMEFDKFKEKYKVKNPETKNYINPQKEIYDFFKKNPKEFEEFQFIFGNQDNIGKVIFLDAFPVGSINLELDIMTPHYSKYYSDKEFKVYPTDYFDPEPITFLTVKKTKFQFGLILKNKELSNDKILELIKNTLSINGIGAKTAVGYGYFINIEEQSEKIKSFIESKIQKEKEKEEQQKLQNMTDIEKECYFIQKEASKKTMDANIILQKSIKLYEKLDNLNDTEKSFVAKQLKEVWQKIGKWEGKQSKKQKEKITKLKSIIGE